jgi:hypothetical protein
MSVYIILEKNHKESEWNNVAKQQESMRNQKIMKQKNGKNYTE